MSKNSRSSSLEEILGFKPGSVLDADSSLVRVPVDRETLVQLFSRWSGLEALNVPELLGMTISPTDDSRIFLNLIFDREEGARLCVEADLPRDRVLPDFSLIWPFAHWWQDELAVFWDIRFDGKKDREEITWRRA